MKVSVTWMSQTWVRILKNVISSNLHHHTDKNCYSSILVVKTLKIRLRILHVLQQVSGRAVTLVGSQASIYHYNALSSSTPLAGSVCRDLEAQ